MMPRKKFYRRWKRRFLASLRGVEKLLSDCWRTGEAEAVHDLRVTLRRARLLALVGTSVLGKARSTHFRQWALKLAGTLSRLRDHDVMLEWLKANFPSNPQTLTLQTARNKVWRQARPKLLAMSRSSRWPAAPASSTDRREGNNRAPRWKSSDVRPEKLRKQFHKQCEKIRARLKQDAARFDQLSVAGRHEFRRVLRRLRYLRELSLRRRKQKADVRLTHLIAFQEALGEMQNCFLVCEYYSAPSRARAGRELAKLSEAQEQKWLRRAEAHLLAFRRERARY